MKKIKVILNEPYRGINSGWPVRYIGFLTQLSTKYHVSIFAPGNTKTLSALFHNASVCPCSPETPLRPVFSYRNYFRQFLKPDRTNVFVPDCCFYPGFREVLKKDSGACDASLYFGLDAFSGYGDLDETAIKLCDLCDSTVRHMEAAVKNNFSPLRILKIRLDIAYVNKFHRAFLPRNVYLLATTGTDAAYISSALPKHKILVLSNGTAVPGRTIDRGYCLCKFKSAFIVFLGFLDYGPNVTSLMYSLEHLWPLVHAKYPQLRFRIIGRNPSAMLKEKAAAVEGVDFVGEVEDIYPYLTEAKLFLAPMFSGGGIKNKFLESLSVGTPVVTNADGAAGIDMVSGVHGVIAESQSGLADAVEAILDAPEEHYAGLVRNCVALAKNYSWETAGKKLCDLIEKLTAQ